MKLDSDVTPEEMKVFLEEADELLDLMEANLLKLEENSGNETLQEIFRAAHTLKGSSAAIGHQQLAALTHASETLLDDFRSGRKEVTSGRIDTLLKALDMMRKLTDEVRSGEDADLDLSDILARLRETEPAIGVDVSRLQEDLAPLDITVKLAPDTIMPAVRAYQVLLALDDLGEILQSSPTSEEIEAEEVGDSLKLILLTDAPRDVLRSAIVAVPDVVSVQIHRATHPEPARSAPIDQATTEPAENAVPASPTLGSSASDAKTRSVKVNVGLLDNLLNYAGELVIERTRMERLLNSLAQHEDMGGLVDDLTETVAHIGSITNELQEQIMKARMIPLESIFRKFPRLVRDLAQRSNKKVDFSIEGEDTELDRSVLQEISDPLIHLLRNSVDHGIEPPDVREKLGKDPTGKVLIRAYRQENQIIIIVEDDGKGIDPEAVKESAIKKGLLSYDAVDRLSTEEAINLIFLPGLSTKEEISEVSGRGVGMDVIKRNIEKVNGKVSLSTEVGKGTRFTIELPLTLAILRALLCTSGDTTYAIPLSSVREIIKLDPGRIHRVQNQEVIKLRDEILPIFLLSSLLGEWCPISSFDPPEGGFSGFFTVVINHGTKKLGIVVDSLIGDQEIVLKSLGRLFTGLMGIAGATILGDGTVALILDVSELIRGYSDSL